MREDKDREEAKRRKAEQKIMKRNEAEAMAGVAMETGAAIDEDIEIERQVEDIEKAEFGQRTR